MPEDGTSSFRSLRESRDGSPASKTSNEEEADGRRSRDVGVQCREEVYVHRTKDQIKDSPKFGDTELDDPGREEVGGYYGPGGAGFQER